MFIYLFYSEPNCTEHMFSSREYKTNGNKSKYSNIFYSAAVNNIINWMVQL